MKNLHNRLAALIQLGKDNASLPRDFRVVKNEDEATIYVYDVIGGFFGGIDAETFARELSGITANTIHLRVNTPGGDVFDAQAMQVALREHPAKVIAHVDGAAASAGSTLIMAADTIKMARGARIMIHEAWTLALGNKRDLRDTANLLESLDADIVDLFAKRTGNTPEQIATWLEAETWFNADEAKANGFADEIVEVTGKTSNRWNLSAYKNAPTDIEELSLVEPCLLDEDSICDLARNINMNEHRANLARRLRLLELTGS